MHRKQVKKIIIVLPSLAAGGAERVLSFLAQRLDSIFFETHLLILGKSNDTAYNTGTVKITYLEKSRVSHAIFGLLKFLVLNKPDIVFSSLGHVNTLLGLLAFLYTNPKYVIRPTNIQDESKPLGKLSKFAISQIDAIVCQSKDMADNFMKIANISEKKISIIGNPITNQNFLTKSRIINRHERLITVGRLSKIKGHIRILNILSKTNLDFHYTIVGDGPEKKNIREVIKNLELESKVTLVPFTKNVDKYISDSDLFLQGSYSEGFPNAVLESCTQGVPVLAFNVPGGTKEIIEHGLNGYLVESESNFLNYLEKDRLWNSEVIRNSVISRFSSDVILKKYEELFSSIIA
ncbi:glycosyltransferase [Zobellia roscoffensis]|uniref:glycosyltransferase n=1 Tax=Zobellia roscoffensis TaxID=2779508 RepID=UPI00188C9020|nr:glycosyltransferase [Zobellia roscoffensis]